MARPNRKHISVDVPEVIHEMVKMAAQTYNISITRYVLRAILEKIRREGHKL